MGLPRFADGGYQPGLALGLLTACLVCGGSLAASADERPVPPLPIEGVGEGVGVGVTSAEKQPQPPLESAVRPAGLAVPEHRTPGLLEPVSLVVPAAAGGGSASSSPPAANWSVLAAILGAFGVLVAFRVVSGRRSRTLPAEVFDVLGEASLGGHHAVRVVRFGPRTLLVGVSSAGSQTLAEIDDPALTERIAAACLPRPAPRSTVSAWSIFVRGAVLLAAIVPAAARAEDSAAVNAPAMVAAASPEPAGLESFDPLPPEPAPAPATNSLEGVPPVQTTPLPISDSWLPAGLLGERPLAAVLPSMLLLGVATLAPAVLLMTTCFVRMSVVLALVRQGLGAAQVPSNQILASLAIFLSALVMWPVWTQAWNAGVKPYQEGRLTAGEAFEQGGLPIRRWMAAQIEQAGNRDTMLLFLARHPAGSRQVASYDDVPLESLLPAFLVSELETAFTVGFRLLLPFLVLDILVATLVVSTGLVMLPPTLVSLPLKLLVFVAADGWTLIVKTLLSGFAVA